MLDDWTVVKECFLKKRSWIDTSCAYVRLRQSGLLTFDIFNNEIPQVETAFGLLEGTKAVDFLESEFQKNSKARDWKLLEECFLSATVDDVKYADALQRLSVKSGNQMPLKLLFNYDYILYNQNVILKGQLALEYLKTLFKIEIPTSVFKKLAVLKSNSKGQNVEVVITDQTTYPLRIGKDHEVLFFQKWTKTDGFSIVTRVIEGDFKDEIMKVKEDIAAAFEEKNFEKLCLLKRLEEKLTTPNTQVGEISSRDFWSSKGDFGCFSICD